MSRSEALFERAKHTIPGGVNSPVRAFKAVGGTPRFMERAEGAYLFDADGKRYIDYVLSWGPMIMGHNHPRVREAVVEAAQSGLSFGCPTEIEIELAETISKLVPSMPLVRMTSSGTEATMSAIRLARGFTGRDKIIKFEGCYHGHSDSLLIKAGSGALTFGVPSSPGVPDVLAQHTVTLPFNDLAALEAAMDELGDQVACVITEPVAGNMNCIPSVEGYLEGMRELCTRHGAVLIFDEVMTGFRVSPQCAQGLLGVTPDLTTLGKIVGGGMPMGVVCGPQKYMEHFSPTGAVYQAGTLSGNPLSVAAGIALLKRLHSDSDEIYNTLDQRSAQLHQLWKEALDQHGIPHSWHRVGSMFGLFFTAKTVNNFHDASQGDVELFKKFFHGLLAEGVAIAPSSYEAGFVSLAHTAEDIEFTAEAIGKLKL